MGKRVLQLVTASKPKSDTPDEDILRTCRELLRMAEAGELRAVACAVDLTEGHTAHSLAFTDGTRGAALLGAIGLVRRKVEDICLAMDDEEG